MSESQALKEKLLELKPELTSEVIDAAIIEKKEKIGAGYLTDQGAIFLVAHDYGVTLTDQIQTTVKLGNLPIGAKEISLESRVLSLSSAKQYSRKDGSPFYLRTMTVYDGKDTASVKLWDEKAKLPGLNDLKPGDLIKIIKAYVKEDLNGAPIINIGSGANVEPTSNSSEIPTIDTLTRDISEINEEKNNLVVSGLIDGQINTLEYTNKRGDPSTALRLRLKGSDGKSMKVILWGKSEADIPKVIAQNATMTLFGVQSKNGNQGDLEIQGNESAIIKADGSSEIMPKIVRIISIVKTESGDTLTLGVDKDKNIVNIKDVSNSLSQYTKDQIIECMPSKSHGNAITLDSDSFVRKLDEDSSIPTVKEILRKISDLKVDEICCIEAIVLRMPDSREIATKRGEQVLLAEMFVEDATSQIWVKGWANQARLISTCSIGEIISITGVLCKAGLESKLELSLTTFSTITKKV